MRKERILSQILVRDYFTVDLYKDGKRNPMRVNILMGIVFLDHVPNGHEIVVEHKNKIKTDNRLVNLELITNRENVSRRCKTQNKTSKYTGVCWVKREQKWMAQIQINGKTKHLGYFTDEYDAHLAYQKALSKLK